MESGIDPFTPEALEDPYPLYERLRREAPVWRVPGTDLHLVTGHDEIVEVVGDPDTYSSKLTAFLMADEADGGENAVSLVETDSMGPADVLAVTDPPGHTRHRKLVSRAFAERRVAALELAARARVRRWLEPALADGRGEWMATVATPLPVVTIAAVLGLPGGDVPRLKAWSDAGVELLGGVASPERMGELLHASGEFLAYCSGHVHQPPTDPRIGVVDTLAGAVEDGDLPGEEATAMLLQLVIAGAESTASLTGSAVRILAEQPDLQEVLRAEPGRIPAFVEEALRLESPFRGHFRVARRDVTLGGAPIPAGSRLMLMWGAANRDPEAHPCPGQVDLGRDNPRAHFGFGWGLHFCIGAPLARLQARVALETLLASTRRFAIDANAPAPRHVPSLFVRRLAHLHLRLHPA